MSVGHRKAIRQDPDCSASPPRSCAKCLACKLRVHDDTHPKPPRHGLQWPDPQNERSMPLGSFRYELVDQPSATDHSPAWHTQVLWCTQRWHSPKFSSLYAASPRQYVSFDGTIGGFLLASLRLGQFCLGLLGSVQCLFVRLANFLPANAFNASS